MTKIDIFRGLSVHIFTFQRIVCTHFPHSRGLSHSRGLYVHIFHIPEDCLCTRSLMILCQSQTHQFPFRWTNFPSVGPTEGKWVGLGQIIISDLVYRQVTWSDNTDSRTTVLSDNTDSWTTEPFMFSDVRKLYSHWCSGFFQNHVFVL